jgi:hypothetical protein
MLVSIQDRMSQKVKVVVPIYRSFFGELEEESFLQCYAVLSNYDIVLVQPEGLDTSFITSKYPKVQVEYFPKPFFQSIDGYNELLLSSIFYERFIQSEFILIYQLDAFVFSDQLAQWCAKDYDYVGAPWIATQEKFPLKQINALLKPFKSHRTKRRDVIFYKVGNGGFSLRKTATHLKIATEQKDVIQKLLADKERDLCAIEDVFWSIRAPELYPNFKIPLYQEALGFAMDRKPELALKLNNNQMPFGCHGINKNKVTHFWNPFLLQYKK